MSDPPVTSQAEQELQDRSPLLSEFDEDIPEDEQELVTEAYIRVPDVLFNWAVALNPWQSNAIRALTHVNSLTHPDHPLREKGQEHLRLYNCLRPEGHEYLCFSLKQIEYLQYYIHEMRLADPAWTNYLAKLSSGNEEDQPKAGETIPEPPYVEEENEWVPIPGNWVHGDDYAEVELVNIVEGRDIKKMLAKQKKHNIQIDRKIVDRSKLTSEELAKVEAYEENTTQGPGLRRGPRREHEKRRPVAERAEGTGWGGFPTKTAGEEDEIIPMEKPEHVVWREDEKKDCSAVAVDAKSTEDASSVTTANGDASHEMSTPQVVASLPEIEMASGKTESTKLVNGANGTSSEAAEDEDADPRPDALAEQLNKLVDLRAKIDSESPASPAPRAEDDDTPKVEDPIERYFYDAQQAVVLASAGGLATALAQKVEEDRAAGKLEDDDEEMEAPDVPAEIGRSLFFALELTTWEEDENIVLEVGWAATWWQEKLEVEKKVGGDDKKGVEEEEGRFERMTEHGHIIVQDHLLDKRNGKTKPDHRSSYGFGTSTPLPAKDVHRTLSQKLKDLSKRAGSGPIYLLLHSADTDESNFKKLGWKTGGWEKQIRPVDWEYPPYASPEGVGKVFLIDTAKLFGAIENDKTVLPATGKTRKRLEAVAGIMFGSVPEQAPKACANAGNHAAYCLQVFLGIVDSLPLEILRADYQNSQSVPIVVNPPADNDDEDDSVTVKAAPNGKVAALTSPPPARTSAPPDADFVRAMAIKAEKPVIGAELLTPMEIPAKKEPVIAEPEITMPAQKAEEEEEDEDEGIRGVFWEDRNGNGMEAKLHPIMTESKAPGRGD